MRWFGDPISGLIVVLTCPDSIAKEVATGLKSKMVEALEEVLGPELGGSRSVEVGWGPSWGEIEQVGLGCYRRNKTH